MKTAFLDNREEIKKLDVDNALGSIEMLGSQVQQIWQQAQSLKVSEEYRSAKSVVVAGMGGSALGTHVIQTVFKDELRIPVLVAPDYTVPHFVDKHTLVVASSYSGTTEETLSATRDAQKKGALIAGITSGGKVGELLREHHYPHLIFDPIYNPCNAPRMALGYSIFGQIALFGAIGLLKLGTDEYQAVMETIAQSHLLCGADVPQEKNPAKQLAFEMVKRIPIVVVSEHLEGMAHVFANQINENAKTFSEYRVVPELNHHLMEGLQFPDSNEHNLLFITAHSKLYNSGNQKRMTLTEQVIEKNHCAAQPINLTSATPLTQAFELLVLGSYASYYLALLNNQNPTPNPWVDWFKAELKK